MASRTIGLNLTPFIFLIISVFFAFSLKLSRSFFNSFLDYILVAGLFVTLTLASLIIIGLAREFSWSFPSYLF